MADLHGARPVAHTVRVRQRKWLSRNCFELVLEKPGDFKFLAGQKVLIEKDGVQREYSLACSPDGADLCFCVRYLENGTLSAQLSTLQPGESLSISDAYGFFLYRPGSGVFVATGTGIAPFVAYAESGVRGFMMLHGVTTVEDLYYRHIVENAVTHYVPCLSGEEAERVAAAGGMAGRVTDYLAERLTPGIYDFYLCGNGAMIGDSIRIIDQFFPESRVFAESFFA